MFGLGAQELLLLLVCAAVPVTAVVLVLVLNRGPSRQRALEEENRELRRRLEERQKPGDRPGTE